MPTLPSSAEGLAALHQAMLDACALCRPPEKLNVAEWADKYFVLSAEGSARPGKFYTSNAEYQREPMEALSDPAIETVVLMWSSQVGKTQIGLIFVGYHVHHDPAPILFVEPDENLAKAIADDRIKPMIRDTPALTPLFSASSDRYNRSYPGGQLTLAWASAPTQMASRPKRIVITDEEGAYDSAPNREGNPVDLAKARMATFGSNRKHLRVSSPRLRRTCYITAAYERSDQRHFYVPCPQCQHMQTLVWDRLKWPVDKATGQADTSACYYVCEANGCLIVESDKAAMIRAGEWRAHRPGGGDGRTAGFQLSALYSPLGFRWSELVDKYLACEGIPDKLQVFTNTMLGLPWDEQAEGADLNAVARHAEAYLAQAPKGVIIVSCGADVQKDRIEATKVGWGLHEQAWVIEHRVFYGETAQHNAGAWVDFSSWRQERVEHETGLLLPTACTFVDSGDGNRTQAVYAYTRRWASERVFACKGSSQPGSPLASRGNRVGAHKTTVVIVGSSTAKDTIFARLQIDDRSRPGYIHFPSGEHAGCDPAYYSHLTAEKLVTRSTRSGEVARWEKQQKRNEALDCMVYALAAKEFTRANLRALAARLEASAAKLTDEQRRQYVRDPDEADASSPSPASSAALPSPPAAKASARTQKRVRKRILRPGHGWIHGI